ncbi:MAG: hypothetical protein JSS17_04360 [Proteobacteria bacterium]|nr:hypothetical protein [Pseudomonadota bacterium]
MNDYSPLLDKVQHDSFHFFEAHVNPRNGLVRDSTQERTPCSIAAVGFALTCYPVAVRRGWMTRPEALGKTLTTLRFFHDAEQSAAPDATGYRGFFYHFLDMGTGRRAWNCELSTIDTTLLLAGMLMAAVYFDGDDDLEREVRRLANAIYERIDWRWAQNGGAALTQGWTPEGSFLPWRWIGYSEALILYMLALGSPTHAVEQSAYAEWTSGYAWKRIYDFEYVYAGPLFIHQFSHIWIDFRGIFDAYMTARDIDYFENSRRATCVHREYAIRNPHHWENYCGDCWGLTASNGPGPETGRVINGRQRDFLGYCARGAPFGPDDGTVSPWASIASLPFAPELVLPTMASLVQRVQSQHHLFGFYGSFNPTYHRKPDDIGWTCPWHIAINQGPIVAMIENHRDDAVWALMRRCEPIVRGLHRAGFKGGWLDRV